VVIFTEKTYENEKGYFYIPVTWREEFKLHSGTEVGIDCYNNTLIVIDKAVTREFKQIVTEKGKLTIPLELRQKLKDQTYHIIIEQKDERIILAPKLN
jgi:bifunctional DNA-binding transcriptional regulator/antitoxin component of YhaV-PrlF toxin-antitoxin module